jgi:hypothetical protein
VCVRACVRVCARARACACVCVCVCVSVCVLSQSENPASCIYQNEQITILKDTGKPTEHISSDFIR